MTGVSFLLLTKSRSALLSTVFTLVIVYGFVSLRNRRLIPYLGVLAIVASATIFLCTLDIINFKSALSMGRAEASESTMTGRLPLWTELYEKNILKHPIVGYGYGGFWTPRQSETISSDQGWTIGAAHSIYIDASLALGVVGLFLYLAVLLVVLFQAIREAICGRQGGWFFGCLVLSALFDGFSDSGPWFISSIYLFGCIQALIAVSAIQTESRITGGVRQAMSSSGGLPAGAGRLGPQPT